MSNSNNTSADSRSDAAGYEQIRKQKQEAEDREAILKAQMAEMERQQEERKWREEDERLQREQARADAEAQAENEAWKKKNEEKHGGFPEKLWEQMQSQTGRRQLVEEMVPAERERREKIGVLGRLREDVKENYEFKKKNVKKQLSAKVEQALKPETHQANLESAIRGVTGSKGHLQMPSLTKKVVKEREYYKEEIDAVTGAHKLTKYIVAGEQPSIFSQMGENLKSNLRNPLITQKKGPPQNVIVRKSPSGEVTTETRYRPPGKTQLSSGLKRKFVAGPETALVVAYNRQQGRGRQLVRPRSRGEAAIKSGARYFGVNLSMPKLSGMPLGNMSVQMPKVIKPDLGLHVNQNFIKSNPLQTRTSGSGAGWDGKFHIPGSSFVGGQWGKQQFIMPIQPVRAQVVKKPRRKRK